MANNELYHHGILGQKWGIRRYQNPDGSLTEAGRKRLEKKDDRWIKKNYDKIYRKTYKRGEKELKDYLKNDLNKRETPYSSDGRLHMTYVNEYNRKLAELMNKNVSDVSAPSGRVVQFVAKRGDVGVHLVLADPNYDISAIKNGVWNTGRLGYKKDEVSVKQI